MCFPGALNFASSTLDVGFPFPGTRAPPLFFCKQGDKEAILFMCSYQEGIFLISVL